jgi:protein-tyrosine phosphatase
MIHQVLFLCTGNYYRSRFAELLFNHLAGEAGLNWRADSRGFAAYQEHEAGPVLPSAFEALLAEGVRLDQPLRFPLQLQPEDLDRADLVVALDEAEHRDYLVTDFPGWEKRVEYWHIQDLNFIPARLALPALKSDVRALVQRLLRDGHAKPR